MGNKSGIFYLLFLAYLERTKFYVYIGKKLYECCNNWPSYAALNAVGVTFHERRKRQSKF